jgi:glycosyltransferase involved in cell wall biosynthesis
VSLKVIGAGLGRTATVSLKVALERLLGAPCYHMLDVSAHPEHVPVWHAAARGFTVNWRSLLSGYVATVDWPAAAFWEELAEAFPEAIVVLSTRDPTDWWESIESTVLQSLRPAFTNPGPEYAEWSSMVRDLFASRFTTLLEKDAFIRTFEEHNARVRATVPPDRLLEWVPAQGWQPLCRALHVPVPDEPFPWVNRRDDWGSIVLDDERLRARATDRPSLSVVVPTRDRPHLLGECLAHLDKTLRPDDELIVVDSASRGTDTRRVAEAHAALYVRCDEPGASRARNSGWRRARHELVAFVDDDVRVHSGWADELARCAVEFPYASFIAGRIGTPPERPEHPLALKEDLDPAWLDATTPNPVAHTASIAFRRYALEMTGGFDEILGAGGPLRAAEDQDLLDRVFTAGFRGRYTPDAYAVHEPWRTRSEILSLEWSYGIGTGARLVKLLRINRGRIRKVFRDNVWAVVLDAIHAVRVRHKFKIAVCCFRLLGTVVGFIRALPRRVRDEHFLPGRSSLGRRPARLSGGSGVDALDGRGDHGVPVVRKRGFAAPLRGHRVRREG